MLLWYHNSINIWNEMMKNGLETISLHLVIS